MSHVEEALKVYERLDDRANQAQCLMDLAQLLHSDKQLSGAEEAATRAMGLLSKDEEFLLSQCHRFLGHISRSRREREKAMHHYETALAIASASHWINEQFWIHHSLATLFLDDSEFDDATTHLKQARQCVADDKYCLGRAMQIQAQIWYQQGKHGDAKLEVSCAIDVFEKLGAAKELDNCRGFLQRELAEQ